MLPPKTLRALRKAQKLSQEALAQRLCIDQSRISKCENGILPVPAHLEKAWEGALLPPGGSASAHAPVSGLLAQALHNLQRALDTAQKILRQEQAYENTDSTHQDDA